MDEHEGKGKGKFKGEFKGKSDDISEGMRLRASFTGVGGLYWGSSCACPTTVWSPTPAIPTLLL
eukprot:7283090-Lingulodinium_polyedra.AAC.1